MTSKIKSLDTRGKRCRYGRLLRGLTQAQLAKMIGVTACSVAKLERDEIKHCGFLVHLEILLSISAVWLETGNPCGALTASDGVRVRKLPYNQDAPFPFGVPVISWDEAGKTIFKVGDIKNPEDRLYFQPRSHKAGLDSFALSMEGSSMEAPLGEASFLKGDILFFDPNANPQIGHYILAREKDAPTAIFRKLISEAGALQLVASNPKYPIIPITKKIALLGVLVDRVTVFL